MQFVPYDLNLDFMGRKKVFIGVSLVLLLASVVSLTFKGINFGIDFTGGTETHVKFKDLLTTAAIRDTLKEFGLGKSVVQEFGEPDKHEFLIRSENRRLDLEEFKAAALTALRQNFAGQDLVSFQYEGGSNAYLKLATAMSADKVRELVDRTAFPGMKLDPESDRVQLFGKESDNEFLIKFINIAQEVEHTLITKYGREQVEVLRVETVGPKVGKELQRDGLLAVLAALFFIMLYIAFRFDMKFAPGAIIALFHDVLITVGLFSFLQLDFSLSIVAALLALVGYSINDTVVVYDRIRENVRRFTTRRLEDVINSSINQTMSRTLLTSLTTLLVTVTLFLVGGSIIKNFAFTLTFGIVIGTYSSIFIASPMTIYLDRIMERRAKGKA